MYQQVGKSFVKHDLADFTKVPDIGINSSIKAIATQKQTFSDRLTDIEKRYRATYTALDVSLASMQSTQTYLTQQLASIAANS